MKFARFLSLLTITVAPLLAGEAPFLTKSQLTWEGLSLNANGNVAAVTTGDIEQASNYVWSRYDAKERGNHIGLRWTFTISPDSKYYAAGKMLTVKRIYTDGRNADYPRSMPVTSITAGVEQSIQFDIQQPGDYVMVMDVGDMRVAVAQPFITVVKGAATNPTPVAEAPSQGKLIKLETKTADVTATEDNSYTRGLAYRKVRAQVDLDAERFMGKNVYVKELKQEYRFTHSQSTMSCSLTVEYWRR